MRTADQNISHGKEKNFLTDVWLETLAKRSEAVLLPLGALIVGLLTFGLFLYFLESNMIQRISPQCGENMHHRGHLPQLRPVAALCPAVCLEQALPEQAS